MQILKTNQDGTFSYRDMTAEEIAELEAIQSEQPTPQPTAEERIAELEELIRLMLNGGAV